MVSDGFGWKHGYLSLGYNWDTIGIYWHHYDTCVCLIMPGKTRKNQSVYHNVFHSKILNEEFVRCFTHVQTHFHRQNRRCPNQKTGHSGPGLLGPLGSWPGSLTAPHELCVAQRFRELASLDHGRSAERMQGKPGQKEFELR
jgi:hypothetical protein